MEIHSGAAAAAGDGIDPNGGAPRRSQERRGLVAVGGRAREGR